MTSGQGKSAYALTGDEKVKFQQNFTAAQEHQRELERGIRAGLPVEELLADHKIILGNMKAFKAQYVD